MKRVIHIIIIALLCVMATSASAQSRREQRASRHAEMTFTDGVSHDFGDVERKGGDLIKVFRFVNSGQEPLVIKKVTKSCSCLTADFSRKPVKAGESGEIRIKYEPHKVEAGKFHKVVQIYTNSSEEVHLVTIHGNSVEKRGKRK